MFKKRKGLVFFKNSIWQVNGYFFTIQLMCFIFNGQFIEGDF